MSKANSLDKYSRLVAERNKHIEDNKSVFDAHEKIVFNILDAENELRDKVAEEFESLVERAKTDITVNPEAEAGINNGEFNVVVAGQEQTWADIDAIDKLIVEGVIPSNRRSEIVKTQKRPPRISIRKI